MRKAAFFFFTQPVSVTCFALSRHIVLAFMVLLMERVEDEAPVVFMVQTDVLHNFYGWKVVMLFLRSVVCLKMCCCRCN